MSTVTLYPSGPATGVDLGEAGAIVTNRGAGTVSYSDVAEPFVAEGTIVATATATLSGTQFFRATTGAVLGIVELDASLESLEAIRAQLLAVGSSNLVGIDLGGNLGATEAIDTGGDSVHAHSAILNANCAITTTNKPAGEPRTIKISGVQDATGGRTITVDGAAIVIPDDPAAGWEVIGDWDGGDIFWYFPGGSGLQGIQGEPGIQGDPGPQGDDGDMTNPMTTAGDLVVGGVSGAPARLAKGTDGQVLKMASGSVGWGVPGGGIFIPYRVGEWIMTPHGYPGLTAIGLANGTGQLTPIYVGRTQAIDRIGCNVTTAATTGTIRLGIYSDDGAGKPGALLVDAGTVSATSTGLKEITISETLAPGVYWLDMQADVTGTLNVSGAYLPLPWMGRIDQSGANGAGWRLINSGALPSTGAGADRNAFVACVASVRAA